jgi:hypothetical protein
MLTGNISLMLLLAVYGVDSVITIILRLLRRENIFQALRSHLYQYLVNTNKLPHLQVAGIYALLQAFINILVLYNLKYELLNSYVMFTGVISLLSVIYFILITVVIGKPIFKRAS